MTRIVSDEIADAVCKRAKGFCEYSIWTSYRDAEIQIVRDYSREVAQLP